MKLGEDYDILGIYSGGFATVYKVRHLRLGYVRAVKVLKDAVLSENDKTYQTFLKECQLMLQIGNGNCPSIIKMYSPHLIGTHPSVEMDFIQGKTLDKYLSEKSFMTIAEVMRLVQDIGGALAYCHHDVYQFLMNPIEDHLTPDPNDGTKYVITDKQEHALVSKYQVVHNDIHSGNVMRRDYDGTFVLLDFGLAIQDGKAVRSTYKNAGAIEFKPPEKWEMSINTALTPQSDIYSFGVLLYQALAGRPPFEVNRLVFSSDLAAQNEMRRLHCEVQPGDIEPLREQAFQKAQPGQKWVKDYPDWLEQLIMKCLAKNPADRYADGYELMKEFNHHINDGHLTAQDFIVNELKQQLQEAQQNCEQLKKERKSWMRTNENLSNENKQLSLRNKELRENLKKADNRGIKTPWGWMLATCILLGSTLGLMFSDTSGKDKLNYLSSLMPWYSTDSCSTVPPTTTIDSVTIDHNKTLNDGNGMELHVNLNVEHMKGRVVRVVAFFYDNQGNPLNDRNNLYASSDGHVATGTTVKPNKEESKYKDLVLSIPYAELHQRNKEPETLQYKICVYDQTSWQPLFIEKTYHTFEFDILKMPHAMFNKVWFEQNVMKDGKKSLLVHSNFSVVGMKGKKVYYSVFFYKQDNKTPLMHKDGYQIFPTVNSISKSERYYWSDWCIIIPNTTFLGAVNLDDKQRQCSFDIVAHDEEGRVLGCVKNKKIRMKQN